MALIKNKAKEMAVNDSGLHVNTDSYLRECIYVSGLGWKASKEKIDDMDRSQLDEFILATGPLNLNKSGTVTFRLSVREYAQLKANSLKEGISQTRWLEGKLKNR